MEQRSVLQASYASQIQRLHQATHTRSQSELAGLLGISQAAVSDSHRRQHIPSSWLVILLRLKQINPDWVLTGQEPQYLHPALPEFQDKKIIPSILHDHAVNQLPTVLLAIELLRRVKRQEKRPIKKRRGGVRNRSPLLHKVWRRN